MFKRNYLAMLAAEFLGTGILTLVILSIQRTNYGIPLFVGVSAGLAIVVLTLAFGRASVAHFNPAITIAFWTARRIKTIKMLFFVVFQVLGAWAAYGLYHYFVNTPIQEITTHFDTRIMVAEAIGTMILALACAGAAFHKFDNARSALASGVGYVLAIMVASAASVGISNPAVALGAHAWDVFGSLGWGNFVLGPILGAVIGVNLYSLLFANPETPFAFFKRRTVVATGPTVSAPIVDDEYDDDDEDDSEEIEESETPIDVDKAINENAKAGRNKVAPRSKVTVTKSKKSAVKKVAATKKSASKKKR